MEIKHIFLCVLAVFLVSNVSTLDQFDSDQEEIPSDISLQRSASEENHRGNSFPRRYKTGQAPVFRNFLQANAQSGCGGGDWIQYNDEKCILILDNFVNAEEATSICTSQSPSESSNLLSIKTKEELLDLTHQLYDVSGVFDNVWVAARRSKSNPSTFIWTEDNSPVRYSNWAPGFPSNDTRKGCVQMISRQSRSGNNFGDGNGQWEDISCLRRNLVVCQKLRTFSPGELERIVMDNRRRVEENEKKVEENEKKVEEYEQRLEEVENNPVPLGFIYVQLSGQPEPNEIWKRVKFTDVTSTYAGQFFRALGGDSSEFGTPQNFSSPNLSVEFRENYAYVHSVTAPFGSWSPYIYSGIYEGGSPRHYYGLRFMFETSEVRPYNSAVKIWKRTA